MGVVMSVLPRGVGAEKLSVRGGDPAFVRRDHIRVDLVHIHRVRVIHHIRVASAGWSHIDLERDKIALFAQALAAFCQTEEFEMNEAAVHAEGLRGPPAELAQLRRGLGRRVVEDVQIVQHAVHHRRIDGHGLKQRLPSRVEHGVVGTDIALDELLHDIGHQRKALIERVQLRVIAELPGVVGADAVVRLDDHGIADLPHEGPAGVGSRDDMLARGRDPLLQKHLLHQGFFLDGSDPVAAGADGDVEIRAELCVQLEPEFVHGFQPVDPAVFEGKEGHGAIDLVVVLQRTDIVVFGQRFLQPVLEAVVGRLADPQHVHAVAVQAVAEEGAGAREIGGNKDIIQNHTSCVYGTCIIVCFQRFVQSCRRQCICPAWHFAFRMV